MSKYQALKQAIGHGHAAPPDSFLDELVKWASSEQSEAFAPNAATDIYTLLRPAVGNPQAPYWNGELHRRAAMCEAMRCIAGDEADWNWNEGRDTTAGPQQPEEMEAGLFQVSYDSRNLDSTLRAYLVAHGVTDAAEFQYKVKNNHAFCLAYTARLLRVSTRWDGPCNRGWIAQQVSKAAVAEFERLISFAA